MQWVISLHFWHTLATQWEWIIFNLKVYYFHSVWRSIKSPLSLDSIANSIAAVAFKHHNKQRNSTSWEPNINKISKTHHSFNSLDRLKGNLKCRKHLIIIFSLGKLQPFFPWLFFKRCHFSIYFSPAIAAVLGFFGSLHICATYAPSATSMRPPHNQLRNDWSMFSPPHATILVS